MGRISLLIILIYCNFSLSKYSGNEVPIIPKPKETNLGKSFYYIDICFLNTTFDCNPKIKNDVINLYQFYYKKIFFKPIICDQSKILYQNKIRTGIIEEINVFIDQTSDFLLLDDFNQDIEEYSISVGNGELNIQTKTYVGFVRAIESVAQLIESKTEQDRTYRIGNSPLTINDYPSYKVRGITLDVSRHFISIDKIKNIINGMMFTKLNILHFHFSDDDSYPLESIAFPDLTKSTTFNGNCTYTINQIRSLIDFAATRAVHIIPEFENPAHIRALGSYFKYINTVVCYGYYPCIKNPGGINTTINGFPPGGNFDPTLDLTYFYANSLINDVVQIFNSSRHIHLGGDDTNYTCWDTRKSIKDYMVKNNIPTYDDMMNIYLDSIRKNLTSTNSSKIAIYWSNEDTFNLKYLKTDTLQFKGNSQNISLFLSTYPNNPVIISAYDYFFFDCGYGGPFGETSTKCDPYKSWLMIYGFNLSKYVGSSTNVLGIIAPAWTKVVNDDLIESYIFPRGTSLGEKLWSNITDIDDLTSIAFRIVRQSKRMKMWGVKPGAISKQWCEEHTDICFSNATI